MKQLILLSTVFLCLNPLLAQVDTQWRGENRDGVFQESHLLKVWPEEGPELLWVHDSLPTGYSSAIIGEELIYVTGLVDTLDHLIALNHQGEEQWRKPIGRGWTASFSDSRSTPTLIEGRVYVGSGYCYVACFDAITGEEIWKVNVFEKFEGRTGKWGYAESPLVVDDKVLVCPGGMKTNMVALDKNTGETIWQTESLQDTSGYASPILIEENGFKIAVNVMANEVFGVNVADGEILFKHNYSEIDPTDAYALWNSASATRINTNNPVYYNQGLYITSGYNHVGAKFELSDDFRNIELMWTDSILDVHFGGVVLVDGFIYGSNWINNANGDWCCLNWETGECTWVEKWNNKGNIIYADGLLYIYEEKRGNIGIVKPDPEKFEVISSFRVKHGKGPHWGHPVIKNGILYIRHGEALMAYDILEKE